MYLFYLELHQTILYGNKLQFTLYCVLQININLINK